MKKSKILLLLPFAGMILSGCDFNPESLLKNTGDFFTQTIPQEFQKFVDGMMGRKSEEPKKEEKEEQPEGQEEQQPETQKQLVSISVSGQFKQEYELGEEFDPTGVVVTAAYNDGSSEDVSSQASFSGFSSEAKGDVVVTASFGGQSATFTVSIVKTDWTSAEKQLMADHLHGLTLPFLDVDGAEPKFNQDKDSIEISGLTFSGNEMKTYAGKFLASDGWDDVTLDYGEDEGVFYSFEKSTQTENGMRRIAVKMYCLDSSQEYAAKGAFSLSANDPFSYNFPSADLAAEFNALGLPAFTIPAPEASDLYFEFTTNPYNAENLEYLDSMGYSALRSYVYSRIYIYGLSSQTFEAYASQLQTADWVLTAGSGANDWNYYASKEIADQGVANFKMALTSNYTVLNIELLLGPLPVKEWPAADVAALLQTVVPNTTTVIPAISDESITNFEVDTDYDEIDVYGPEELKAKYEAILSEANWTEQTDDYYVSPLNDVQIHLIYSTKYGLRICLAPAPVWPETDAAALVEKVAPGSTTVVPPCPNGLSYDVYNSSYLSEIDVWGPESLLAAYAAVLKAANWSETSEGTNIFISPAQDMQLILSYSTSWGLVIEFSSYEIPAAVWPAEDIAQILGSGITDTVPAFEGENSGFNVLNDQFGTAVMVTVEAGTETDAISAYQTVLTTAGYKELLADYNGDMQYVSPNDQILVCAYYGTAGTITISFSPAPALTWPAAEIASKFNSDIDDVLPALNGAVYYTVQKSGLTAIRVIAYFEDATAATSALEGYATTLTTASFTELGEDSSGDMNYGSPDSEYSLCPYVYSNMVVIDITQPGPSTWPGTEIAALLASYGFTDAIPVMSGADEYNISDYYGYPQIYVYFSNASDAEAACSAYQSALLTAGFTDAGDYYGDPKYASPNQQFEISPWIGSSGTTVIIDIAEQLG